MYRLLLALAFLLLTATSALAQPAHSSFNAGATGTGNLSWNHTDVADIKGVAVMCGHANGADEISSVTIGGVAASHVTGSPLVKTAAEDMTTTVHFLGSGITKTGGTDDIAIAVNVSGSTAKRCSSYAVTASTDTSIDATDTIQNDSLLNPSDTLVTSTGVETVVYLAIMSGHNATTGITPSSGYAVNLESAPGGNVTLEWHRKTTNPTGGNVTWGWTQTAEDANGIAIAIREVAAPTTNKRSSNMRTLGVGR